ncbi:MAG TPA: YncE family protein [Candidatus Bathyarchaeia archaeon]|nr:YncE family protein [Candidatus Bathyarchaeia archaeon]
MQRISRFVLVLLLAAMAMPAAAQMVIATVPVQNDAFAMETNPATNMLYVVNTCGTDPSCGGTVPGTVTVINGATNMVAATVNVGIFPEFVTINSTTNKIYVSNRRDNTVSVINGATNTVIKTISVGSHPTWEDVNPITNKIYVVNNGNGQGTTLSVIDGNTDTVTTTVTVGNYPQSVSVDPVRNKVYVANYCGNQFGCNATPAPGTVSVIDGATNHVTATVTVGYGPAIVFVNAVTNKIYAENSCGNTSSCDITGDNTNVIGTVTQIDGSSLATQTVSTGQGSVAMTYNAVANKVYVSNNTDNTESFIDGVTLQVSTVNVGTGPADVEVDPARNTIYVCNSGSNTVTAINGATLQTTTVSVGNNPEIAWVNPVVDRVYVSNLNDDTVSVLSGVAPNAIQFVNVTPCRLYDTRPPTGSGPIMGGTSENFVIPGAGGCGIPDNAIAYSLNVTVVPGTSNHLGYLTIWPTGEAQPVVSTMNSTDGRTKANAVIVPGGYQGAVSVFVTNTTNVILDINGYFTAPTPGLGELQFYPLTPCRILDTRQPGNGGTLQAGVERDVNIAGNCGIPTTAEAYSLNVAVLPARGGLDYLTVWPAGETKPLVSTLNDSTGTIVANAAIVPAGPQNATAFYPHSNNTDLLVDVDGYFAAAGTGGLSLYPAVPCRVVDTRQGGGSGFNGQITVGVEASPCALPSNAQAYVFNATVVPPGHLLYLTLWPHGETQPVVSTLNANDGFITSNLAIVPTNDGSIDAFASSQTQLILDISGYFAP